MTDWDLVVALAAEFELTLSPQRWSGLDELTPLVERILADSGTFLVKVDGERSADRYTAVLSRQPAEDWVVRRDAETLQDAVTFVLARYSEHRNTIGRIFGRPGDIPAH